MATNQRNNPNAVDNGLAPGQTGSRFWRLFAIRAFAVIVARKHNMAVPLDDIEELSDEDLEVRLRLVQELAHLPPA
jgi:hypothetical protein